MIRKYPNKPVPLMLIVHQSATTKGKVASSRRADQLLIKPRVMSGIITAPAFNYLFTATRDNPTMQGFVTAIYEIGCLFGAIFILGMGDFLGRRRAMIIGGLTMIVRLAFFDALIAVCFFRISINLRCCMIPRQLADDKRWPVIALRGNIEDSLLHYFHVHRLM